MLPIYLIAASFTLCLTLGSVVLLTVTGVWTVPHTLGIFVLLCVIIMCTWATYALVRAAYGELVYWF